MFAEATTPAQPVTIEEQDVDVQSPAKVLLFNDEIHTFDEVINQIIKAIGCNQTTAEAMTWEVHTRGKSLIIEGTMTECIRVSGVLEEIGLVTQIEV